MVSHVWPYEANVNWVGVTLTHPAVYMLLKLLNKKKFIKKKKCDTNMNTVMASLYANIDYQGPIRAVKWALKENTDMKRKRREFFLKSGILFKT